MTKEEQWKREAEIKLDELDDRGFDFDNWSISDAYERGYCDSAESREKRIAELGELLNSTLEENKEIYKKMADLDTALEDCTESLTDARIKIKELEKENEELKDKLKNLESVAEVRLANWQKYEKENAELKRGCNLTKSLLYCAKRTCDNCGFVNCENFQRQRKSEPCALYISYQDRIKNLTNENKKLRSTLPEKK